MPMFDIQILVVGHFILLILFMLDFSSIKIY